MQFVISYQQLMNAGLSLFTYMKVVRRVKLRLGSWEWKLHTFVISLLLIQVGIYWCFGAFGSSGYLYALNILIYFPYHQLIVYNIFLHFFNQQVFARH